MDMIHQETLTCKSVRIANPEKGYLLKLLAEAVLYFNRQCDANGLSYDKKAMIQNLIALNTNFLWQ